jgi:hypothetical protein
MGTRNVYADLGYGDADEMQIKAPLVSKIAEIIKRKGLTQTQAAQLLGMPQPKRDERKARCSGHTRRRRGEAIWTRCGHGSMAFNRFRTTRLAHRMP